MKPWNQGAWVHRLIVIWVCFLGVMVLSGWTPAAWAADLAAPPSKPVKLVFIHHSTGENLLADGNGGLAGLLQKNNYFVSDTNYGWGPDAIGDRTDIENWPEWFTGSRSPIYMDALFKESGVQSPYRRTLSDPGGENRIVLFKSCFPNSNLEGGPNDPPRRGDGLTVANAKAIYMEILNYFKTRPDRLFVVLTAPPVQDPAHARNARTFNTWLTREWLAGSPGNNVAVFDFYNVLTGKDNHHRFQAGTEEYITNQGKNTSAYPTDAGDDHPNPAGSRKAAQEFVPWLNVMYNRWAPGAPAGSSAAARPLSPAPTPASSPSVPTAQPRSSPAAAAGGPTTDLIDGFEADQPEWSIFTDEEPGTRLTGTRDKALAHAGTQSLRLDYQIRPEGWATHSLILAAHQDWRNRSGLELWLRTDHPGGAVAVVVYNGASPDALKPFERLVTIDPSMVRTWKKVTIPWPEFVQPSWDGDGSTKFDPGRVLGLALAFGAGETKVEGRLWVDDIRFLPAR